MQMQHMQPNVAEKISSALQTHLFNDPQPSNGILVVHSVKID